jgi:excisionase family DNA binding protein
MQLTAQEAATRLRVTVPTIWRYVRAGRLHAVQYTPGGKYWIDAASVDALRQNGHQTAQAAL